MSQNTPTPWEFIRAVEERFGPIAWDLAASAGNCRARDPHAYFDEAQDSLAQDWNAAGAMGRTWLNPPFRHVDPWLAKAAECRITSGPLVLVPASVCTKWFNEHVRARAIVYEVTPRPFAREVRDVILVDFRERPIALPGGGVERRVWKWQ